jgi:3-oxoacyl-[acyl-carrier protein] reductase
VRIATARHVLITGASRGIGAHLVHHHLGLNDMVVGCARGPAPLEHERYVHVQADVTDEPSVRALYAEIRRRFGALDVLINNAGAASMNPVALTPFESARNIVATNFLGTFLMTHAGIRLLRRSKAGRIVNLTTVAVPLRLEGEALYAASKSAVETFTRIAAREVGPFGITCNAVGPSPVKTRLVAGVPAEKMERLIARQAMPRWATFEDVTNVIDFFLQPSSGMVTGQIVYLGGAG